MQGVRVPVICPLDKAILLFLCYEQQLRKGLDIRWPFVSITRIEEEY
jgi:hypothetical protein